MSRTFVFADSASSFEMPDTSLVAPRGAEERIQRAAREALPTALALHDRWLSQAPADTTEVPIILVCTVDCDLGYTLATGLGLTHEMAKAINGPLVWVKPRVEVAAYFGKQAPVILKQIEDTAVGQLFIWAFAVNGRMLTLRTMTTKATGLSVVRAVVSAEETAL